MVAQPIEQLKYAKNLKQKYYLTLIKLKKKEELSE
jgi:hypothetical protein